MKKTVFPSLPANLPQRKNRLLKYFFRHLFTLHGWHIEGDIPNIPKAVVIVAPHTSNIDGWFTFAAMLGLGLKVTIMAKHSLFVPPANKVMQWLGMLAVNRQAPEGLIEYLMQQIAQHQQIWIAIAPEGTRKKAPKWKSGFYRIAQSANIPVVMIALDYQQKTIRIIGTLSCTGDYQQDLAYIMDCYQHKFSAKHPELLSVPLSLSNT